MSIVFQANAGGDKIVLDTTYLPDPFTYKFTLNIQNQSQQTLYFKILSGNSNWSVTSPSNGELGAIGSASSKTFVIQMQRSKPTSDVVETVPLTIEAYTNSGYTNKIDQGTLNLTALVADIRNFENVTIYDFEDGTSQGWTLGSNLSVSNSASVEAGGYSILLNDNPTTSKTTSFSLSTTLPNNSRVCLSLLMAAKFYFYTGGYYLRIYEIDIKVNGTVVYRVDNMENMGYGYRSTTGGQTIVKDWVQIGADLSQYAGQSVTLEISIRYYGDWQYDNLKVWFDDIIIAGTDSL